MNRRRCETAASTESLEDNYAMIHRNSEVGESLAGKNGPQRIKVDGEIDSLQQFFRRQFPLSRNSQSMFDMKRVLI